MKLLTATEASRNFSALLDEVEHGETLVITRGGREVARVTGPAVSNARELKDFLRRHSPAPEWADEIRATRDLLVDGQQQWHA